MASPGRALFVAVVAMMGAALLDLPAADAQGYRRGRRAGGAPRLSLGEIPRRDIFPGNHFTFCRVQYNSWRGYWGTWSTDFPDSDQNFTIRLSELTTIDVSRHENGDPKHVVLKLTDDELFNYPFIYMLEVGSLEFSRSEAERLRDYLLRGGFLLVDDFWGDAEWSNWEMEIQKVFDPDQFPMRDVPLDHAIFNCVFKLTEVPQIPSIHHWLGSGRTYERGADTVTPHCKGIQDLNGRLMVVVMHNTDLGDGWEREGENRDYFREFSAKKAYPMGINIVVYAMTH